MPKDNPQVVHFSSDLDRLLNRYHDEYDLSYAEVLGVLQFKCYLLCRQAAEEGDRLLEEGGE